MEAGSLDGIVTCPPLFLDYELYQVARYGALTTFGCVSEGVVMNKDSWERMPDDLKSIIEDVWSNPFRTTGGLTAEVYRAMMDEIADEGVELYALPPEEAQRWFAKFQEVTRDWVAALEAIGLPARAAVDMFNEECEKRGISCVAYPSEWEE
jgi:TRAP-type C4-dicarboxylate transport system substrate-binding protein